MITLESVLDDSYHNPILTTDTSDMVNNVDVAEAFSTFHMALEAVELYSCAGYVAESTNPENMHVVMEGLGEAIKNAWHKFIEALKKFGAWIKGFFVKTEVKLDDAASKAAAAADIVEQAVAENGGGGDSSNDSGKPASDSNQSNADSGTPLSNAPANHPKPAPEPEVPPSHPDDREETDAEVNENIEKAEEIRSVNAEPVDDPRDNRPRYGVPALRQPNAQASSNAANNASDTIYDQDNSQKQRGLPEPDWAKMPKDAPDVVYGQDNSQKQLGLPAPHKPKKKSIFTIARQGIAAKFNDIKNAIIENKQKFTDKHKTMKISFNPTLVTGNKYELVNMSKFKSTYKTLKDAAAETEKHAFGVIAYIKKYVEIFKTKHNPKTNKIDTIEINFDENVLTEIKSIIDNIKEATKIRARQIKDIANDIKQLNHSIKFTQLLSEVERISNEVKNAEGKVGYQKKLLKTLAVVMQSIQLVSKTMSDCTEVLVKDCDNYIRSLAK